jgi:peptidoglycan-associated lipoprotein
MRTFIVALSVAALAAGSTTACATKGFVRNRVGEVNDKVESVSKSLEETQERTRKNEAAIADANQKIVQVDQKAAAGNAAASEAAATARAAADRAAEKAVAVEVATKRIVYEVTISEDQGNFKLNQAALPAEAKTRIDEMVNQLKATPNGAFIEVEGYTDNVGDKAYNEQLGLERAESVKRYLYQAHQIPLHRISVISYGSEKPVAPNTTRAGRAQNRRVVIRVLE